MVRCSNGHLYTLVRLSAMSWLLALEEVELSDRVSYNDINMKVANDQFLSVMTDLQPTPT